MEENSEIAPPPPPAGGAGLYNIKGYFVLIALVWTAILLVACGYDLYSSAQETKEAARIQAVESYNKDILYRRWNTLHGGVYALVGEYAEPNPYMSHIKDRDITTTTGKKLTLMNPAYMSRQVFKLGREEYGMRAHITSLKPLNPANKADAWEAAALRGFEEEALTEVSSISQMDGEEFMRLMRPLVVEEPCLRCHASQGYKVGDIRGGISVAVPMAPLWAGWVKHIRVEIMVYFAIWITGLIGIFIMERRLDMSEAARGKVQAEREKLVSELRESLNNIKTLSGLVPICATCKKIRDDKGYWNKVETYIQEHSYAEFTHGICPVCAEKLKEEAKKLF